MPAMLLELLLGFVVLLCLLWAAFLVFVGVAYLVILNIELLLFLPPDGSLSRTLHLLTPSPPSPLPC